MGEPYGMLMTPWYLKDNFLPTFIDISCLTATVVDSKAMMSHDCPNRGFHPVMIYSLNTPSLSAHTYVIADLKSRQAVVIDPLRDVAPVCALIKHEDLKVTHILETHVHADFVSGALELQRALENDCTIVSSSMGGTRWTPLYADQLVKNGDCIRVGAVRLEAWHTPGHTPEHLTWVVFDEHRDAAMPCLALTGDFLFVGSLGRPDLLGEHHTQQLAHQLYQSVFKILPSLPDHLEIFPAHSSGSLCGKDLAVRPSSTLGYERRTNHLLLQQPETQWIESLLADMPSAPKYFSRMKQINVQGPALCEDIVPPIKLTLRQVAELDPKQVAICDLRFPEAFAACHLSGAINLPLRPTGFVQWAADVLNPDVPLVLLVPDEKALATALTALRLVGLDLCTGYALVDENGLKNSGGQLGSFPMLAPESVGQRVILDVRTPRECAEGQVPDSLVIELGILFQQLDRVPWDRPVAILCRSGFRASIAASLLLRAGHPSVANIRGGMEAWKRARLPVAIPAASR